MGPEPARALSAADTTSFIADGFVGIDEAFSREIAEDARAILWRDTGCDPHDRSTWTRPVVRLGQYSQPPFREAASGPMLRAALDQLVGPGRWLPCGALGTFPIRFPSAADPGDDGWHIDVSFGAGNPDFMEWRANVTSRGRALLMLFLFSDVGPDDAPTRIRAGSHLDIARQLAPAGEAGTVYLCHPFLVHAAQRHRGTEPRFLAQPPLLPREPIRIDWPDGDHSPVEQAIRLAIAGRGDPAAT